MDCIPNDTGLEVSALNRVGAGVAGASQVQRRFPRRDTCYILGQRAARRTRMSEPADRKSRRQFLGMAGIGGAALLRLSGEEQGAAGSNIALNRAAYQSGSADDDHTAHLATDGSTATYWESKPHKEAWIAVVTKNEPARSGAVCAFCVKRISTMKYNSRTPNAPTNPCSSEKAAKMKSVCGTGRKAPCVCEPFPPQRPPEPTAILDCST